MRRKRLNKVVVFLTAAAMSFGGVLFAPSNVLTAEATTDVSGYTVVDDETLDAVLQSVTGEVTKTRNSVHDPSVVAVTENGVETYYVFGSHMGVSKTTDLLNWTSVTSESETSGLFGTINADGTVSAVSYNQAFKSNAFTGQVKVLVDGVETVVDFGTYDASAWNTALDSFNVQGNMWAPDVIYNPIMGKWCMYLSLNGNQWNSSIILLTADNIAGPYVYQGPVVYSGFNGNNAGTIDPLATDLDLIYTNLSETGLPEKYAKGGSWGTFWPHAIDPCVSYDEYGNLYMIYGSWSGGIYALQLDETTGLRDYTVVYPDINAGEASVTSDAYFGTKIAGGAYVSGEGAYVEKIGNYWYLFMSYGFYSPDGGYEMRIFRSDNIAGPYVDGAGNSAIFPGYVMNYGVNGDTRGEKLMGGYQWDTMTKGEIAQGHNSAFTDSKGNTYLVYHTKFNDGSVAHELRVHQLFVNEAGWLVAAPYEYTGQTVNNGNLTATTYESDDIVGEYQVILHKYNTNYKAMEIVTPVNVLLKADGTVSGAYSGTWTVTNGSNINLILDGVTYQGVLVRQMVDGAAMETLCFTVAAANGVNVWGSKLSGDEMAVALTRDGLNLKEEKLFPIGKVIYQGVTLPTTSVQDAVVTWMSSDESTLSAEGKVVAVPDADKTVTLTCQITKGNVLYQKTFDVIVAGKDKRVGDITTNLISKFEFEGDYKDTESELEGVAQTQASGTAPSIKADNDLNSQVAQLNFGFDGASSSNYVKFTNPLKGSATRQATIAFQVKRSDTDVYDAFWGFVDTDDADGVTGKLYLTPNAYLGFNGTGGWFDANHADTVTGAIKVGQWSQVTVTLDDQGFQIYVDGELRYDETYTEAYGSGDFAGYSSMMNLLASADTFYLGYGSWWGTAPFRADDLMFFDTVLDAASVNVLYEQMLAKMEGTAKDEEETSDRTFSQLVELRTYYNDFEDGLGDAVVVGSGELEDVANESFGKVYHNAKGEAGVRSNYLLLPSDTIANAVSTGSNEMSVGFWVNVADATNYWFSPMFMAYGNAPDETSKTNTWPMLALQSRLLAQVNCAGWCDFTAAQNVAGSNKETTAWLDDKEWHYYTATITSEKVCIYVDGVLQNQWEIDGSDGACVDGLFTNGSELDYVCLGGNQAWDWADADASYMFDQVAIYSTALTPGEIQVVMAGEEDEPIVPEEPTEPEEPVVEDRDSETLAGYVVYSNDFEEGLKDTTIVGSGAIEEVEDAHFGKVYHNATEELGVRTNYLLLPSDVMANAVGAGNEAMTIAFWVNVADATNYWFSPMFMAYGNAPDETTKTNTWPMFALQSRLLAQVNCAGWCDFTAAQNVAGSNKETTAWLDDKEWHYYTATITSEKVCIYVDGALQNQWEIDGSDGACVDGLFTNGFELDYVCLGGNQAWDWADADASYMFDDVTIYSTALSAGEIADVMEAKYADRPQEDDPQGGDSSDGQQGGNTDVPSSGGSNSSQTPENSSIDEGSFDTEQTPDAEEKPSGDDKNKEKDKEKDKAKDKDKDKSDEKSEDKNEDEIKDKEEKEDKDKDNDKTDAEDKQSEKDEKRLENMLVDSKDAWGDVIERAKEVIGQADINIQITGLSQVPGDFIKQLSGADVNVVIEMDNGIVWTIHGSTVSGESVDVDFHVDVNTHNIPKDVVEELAEEKEVIQISLAHDGDFGCQPVLTLPLGEEKAGKYANLYYYNETTGIMEFMASGLIDADGKAELRFVHASEYAVVIDDQMALEVEDTISLQETKTPLMQILLKNNVIIYVVVVLGIVLGVMAICYGLRKKEEE